MGGATAPPDNATESSAFTNEVPLASSLRLLSAIEKGPDRWPGSARIVIDTDKELPLAGSHVPLHDPEDAPCAVLGLQVIPGVEHLSGPPDRKPGILQVDVLRTGWQKLPGQVNACAEPYVSQVRMREIVAFELVHRAPRHLLPFRWYGAVKDSFPQPPREGTPDQLDREAEPVLDDRAPEGTIDETRIAARTHADLGPVEAAAHILRCHAASTERSRLDHGAIERAPLQPGSLSRELHQTSTTEILRFQPLP